MAFVRKSPGRSGSTKAQIAERRAGRDVVLEHVGTAHSEAVLLAQAQRRLRPGQELLDLQLEERPLKGRSGVITGKRSGVLWHVWSSVYARLGFEVIEDEAFTQLGAGPDHRADVQA